MKMSETKDILNEMLEHKTTKSGLKLYYVERSSPTGKSWWFNIHNKEGKFLTISVNKKADEDEIRRLAHEYLMEH